MTQNYEFEFTDVPHRALDLSDARRVFVFGDVHGELKNLTDAMAAVDFDPAAGDRAIGLGDWLDRGQDSIVIARYIRDNRDWLSFILGNHEQILWDAGRPGGINAMNLLRNGGTWALDFIDEDAGDDADPTYMHFTATGNALRKMVCTAPVALTVDTPGGFRIGCVHAEIPPIDYGQGEWSFDWDAFIARISDGTPEAAQLAAESFWERRVLKRVMPKIHYEETAEAAGMIVKGVDHVFHGHSIMDEITTWGNTSWIDIGAYKRGEIAFINIDEHIRANA